MRRTRQDLGFVALKVEGGILPAEFLQKVVALEAKGQSAKDYKLPKGTTIKDEIGRAWRIASAEWREYRENYERQDVDRTRIGIDQWLVTLLKVVLGHDDIASGSAVRMGDRAFPITHKSVGGAVPLVLTTENFRLDKTDTRFGEEGRRRSPHALMQEFLNASEDCLWGVISNGRALQLLRDNPSLTKPAYIEADLERIFEEQLYSDFAAMWLIFHGSRFTCGDGKPSECLMEEWRKEGHETGERALADLRKGVTTALKELGNGFLHVEQNTALKEALASGDLSPEGYFRELLRLVYRLLFLLCVEDRELLHASDAGEQARWLYRKGYSLSRLRECALLKRNYDRHWDMWEGLRVAFQSLRRGEKKLGLPALGGLFVESHCPYIEQSVIGNQFLLRAVFALSFFRTSNVLARVNYRDMGTEELGSVYESLLELHPSIDVARKPWMFEFVGERNGASGSERKLSGSYYTPASLVNQLIKSTVDPIIEDVKVRNSENPRKALLELKIVDPACGSGHFLLATARRLAIEIAKLDLTSQVSEEASRRHALREVVRSCIYGVDKNELALELCKTALWIESVEPGRPLNFLDAHLRFGDSLVGILEPSVIEKGIPDEAYAVLTGDNKTTVSELKRKNKDDRYEDAVVQGSIFDQQSMTILRQTREAVDLMPEETIEQIEAKQEAFKKWLNELNHSQEELKANLFLGAFFAEKTKDKNVLVPRTEDLNRVKRGMAARSGVVEKCRQLAQEYKFFHWHLAFSEVFRNGGFDIVLGNPPWEKIKLQEKEFFAARSKEIAEAKNKSVRERLIEHLFREDASPAEKMLAHAFSVAKRGSEASSLFARNSGRYPLCGRGDINTYALFAELGRQLLRGRGRAGLILPTGIATDDTFKAFWGDLVAKQALVSFFGFKNEEFLFPKPVEHTVTFGLLSFVGKELCHKEPEFTWLAYNIEHLNNAARRHVLTAAEMRLVNPNTGTCPVFRTRTDAELTLSIYRRVPVLTNEKTGDNPWSIGFLRMFDMSMDSKLFESDSGDGRVALYEAKMIHQFDHRFGSYETRGDERGFATLPKTSLQQYQDPYYSPKPFYYVAKEQVELRLKDRWHRNWLLGFRDIARSTDLRTCIFAVMPRIAVGNKIPLVFSDVDNANLVCCLLGNLNSLVFDYVARQKLAGATMNLFIVKQLPVLPPSVYTSDAVRFIVPRVLELSYTAWDLKGFADDVWNTSDSGLQHLLEEQSKANSALVRRNHRQARTEGGSNGCRLEPFGWLEERRAIVKSELDAFYCYLYGLDEEQVSYILDPQDVYGEGFPSETFRVLRDSELKELGEYRTKRLVLESVQKLKNQIPVAHL